MNWGYRIMLVYMLFVAGIVTMAILSFKHPLDMENENYYEAEKQQDEKMRQRKMGNAFRPLIKISQDSNALVFLLPNEITEKQDVQGSLKFMRPADAKQDFSKSFDELKDEGLYMDKKEMEKGFWKYSLEWSHAFGHYLVEDTLTVH